MVESSAFFFVNGALPPDCPSYVKRPVDDELFNAVLDGHHCYVQAAHHMGKSSLMVRTAYRLRQREVKAVTVDLSEWSTGASVEETYLSLIRTLTTELTLPVNPDKWWAERASYEAPERFLAFLRDVVLPKVEGAIAIFVNEIDVTLNPEFLPGFLAAVRSVYDMRATDSAYHRLAFVLLGRTSLSDLMQGMGHGLPDAGQELGFEEFSREEAGLLQDGLPASNPIQREALFDRIFQWTHGHPYLTQRLCLAVADAGGRHWTEDHVDGLVERLFLSAEAGLDPNLQFVKEGILTSERRRQLLSLYRDVYQAKPAARVDHSADGQQLERLGLVRAENGGLRVRNEIYRLVFDLDWVRANMQTRQAPRALSIAALFVLLLAGVLAFFFVVRPGARPMGAQALVAGFENASGSQERLNSLAALLNLDGSQDEARRLFYEELGPDDRLALFDAAASRPQGEVLVAVVKGLYGDPNLENNPQGNALLLAMAEALAQSPGAQSSEEAELELEIKQWVKGRENYVQGEYDHALRAYNLAISMNDGNPGTYFDRGMSYAAQDEAGAALADLTTVLSLDESWQNRVQRALNDDPRLVAAVWDEQAGYPALVALAPTPTNTPSAGEALAASPTSQPAATPTHTASPQSTDTPTVPPTSTPTLEPTHTPTPAPTNTRAAAPTAASSPAATPGSTSAVPGGTLTLLNPLSVDDPTYGPTDFEWRWSGTLPPDAGFEVRVWKEGQPQAGVHNAVLDNTHGNITQDGDTYRLHTDISLAFNVQGHSDVYWWTVALVRISPSYADLGQQSPPGQLRFEGSSPDSGGGDGGGGVGVD